MQVIFTVVGTAGLSLGTRHGQIGPLWPIQFWLSRRGRSHSQFVPYFLDALGRLRKLLRGRCNVGRWHHTLQRHDACDGLDVDTGIFRDLVFMSGGLDLRCNRGV